MPITVHLPSALRPECGGRAELPVEAETVRGALAELERNYPAIYRSVCDETGAIRRHIHVFVNNTLVCGEAGMATRLESGDILGIMTAVSGG